MGQKQTSRHVRVMSAFPPTADIRQRIDHVRLVPIADTRCGYCAPELVMVLKSASRGLDDWP